MKDPDFVIEPMSSNSSAQSQPARPAGRSSSSSSSFAAGAGAENTRPHESGTNSGTTAPQGRAANALRLDRQSIYFSVNAWIKRLGQTLYYLLTTGSSQQALGEEYCDILQVTMKDVFGSAKSKEYVYKHKSS